jgi:hypothetical protein
MWRRRPRRLRIEPPPTREQWAHLMMFSARIGLVLGAALGMALLGWWFAD